MKRFLTLLVLAAFAVSSALTGCGGSSADSGGATPSPTGQTDAGADLEDEIAASDGDDYAVFNDGTWQTKDYSGQVLKYVDSEHWMFITNKINWGYAYYMGMLEWMELTGATIDMLPAMEITAVIAGITADEGYDIVTNGAYYSMHNLVQSLDDEADYFVGKYGPRTADAIGANIYNGHIISFNSPWEYPGGPAMLYNAELLDRLGVERPSQMFMRGAWTWDAYWELINYVCTLDMTGDGESDYIAVANSWHFSFMICQYEENADGTYKNLADTQKLRDYADMIYNGYNILDIYQEEMPQPWNNYSYSSERYPWIQSVGLPAYDPTCFFGFMDDVGEALEWVPMPYHSDGLEFNSNGGGVVILKGAQNRDAALHFQDFIFDAVGHSAKQMVMAGRRDYGFKGMTGRTTESKEFMEWWANFISNEYARFENSPYYDWNYYEACLEHWENLPVWQGARHGWRRSLFYTPTHQVFKDYPPATAVAMFLEELQALIDEHNDWVLSGRQE